MRSLRITDDHLAILSHLAHGNTLKSHRTIDGEKVYRLHLLDGAVELPTGKIVEQLKKHRFIDSNKKFPAATYLLTDKGRQTVSTILQTEVVALSARNYSL